MLVTTGVFYKRSAGGFAQPMDYREVRDLMIISEERMRKVNLLRLIIRQWRRVRELLIRLNTHMPSALMRFDTSGYMPLLAEVCALIPANDPLLPGLLDLPTHLEQINRNLERMNDAGFLNQSIKIPAIQGLLEQLQLFADDCATCEELLERHFGPLDG